GWSNLAVFPTGSDGTDNPCASTVSGLTKGVTAVSPLAQPAPAAAPGQIAGARAPKSEPVADLAIGAADLSISPIPVGERVRPKPGWRRAASSTLVERAVNANWRRLRANVHATGGHYSHVAVTFYDGDPQQ